MPQQQALTNPSWGVTQAQVNFFTTNVIPVLTNIRNGMNGDIRYSGNVPDIDEAIATLQRMVVLVTDYLAVQGT